MDLLQLEHFVAVVDERSFTRAAERVSRTQPAVSQSVRKLEDEVGVLFVRDAHELTLTEGGKVLLEYARRMLRLRQEALRHLDGLLDFTGGRLSIAATESAALYLLPGLLKSYMQKYPEITVSIYRTKVEEIPRQVFDREVDVGFVKEEPVFNELRRVQIYLDNMIIVASPRHPFASRRRVEIAELGDQHFALHHLCLATGQRVRDLFERHGVRCRIAAESWGFEDVKNMVRQNIALAVVPRISVLKELQEGSLVHVPVQGFAIPRRTVMIFRDPKSLSKPARALLRMVGDFNWNRWLIERATHEIDEREHIDEPVASAPLLTSIDRPA